LKKKYLTNLEKPEDHLHRLTLTMKDEDFEYEWRLGEINSRKTMATLVTLILCLLTDVMWTIVLSSVNTTGKIIKAVIETFICISLFMTFYHPKVKRNLKTLEMIS
jgi:hypothetical protein